MRVEKILELSDNWGIEEYGEEYGFHPVVGIRHKCNGDWHMALSIIDGGVRMCSRCNTKAPPEVMGFYKLCSWRRE